MTYLHLAGATALTAVSSEYPVTDYKYWPLISSIIAFILLIVLLMIPPSPLKYIVFGVFVVLLGQTLSLTAKQLGQKGLLDDVILSVLGIFAAMSVAGFIAGDRALGFGIYLFVALIGLLLGRIVFGLLGFTEAVALSTTQKAQGLLSWFGAFLFSIYVAYDTAVLHARARLREKRPDYIDASLGLFLDILNLFGNLEDVMD